MLSKEAAEEGYDVIVVGSGIGGLSAASLLAKSGKKVLVVEKDERPGGNLQAGHYGRYTFDAAFHIAGGYEPDEHGEYGLIDSLLTALGVRNECSFLRVSPIYTAAFPGFRLHAPLGVEAYQHEHARRFPAQEKYLRDLINLCSATRNEFHRFPLSLSFWDVLLFPDLFPSIHKYSRATLAAVLDEYLTDPWLKSVCSAMWLHLGLPPSRISFLFWAVAMMNYVEEGAFYCRGSLQTMVDAFVDAIAKNAGQLLLGTRVKQVIVEDEQVRGVVLDGGQRIQAPIVVSNADVLQTFEKLVGFENLPAAYFNRIRKLKPSLSSCMLCMATDLELQQLGIGHEMLMFKHWDHDRVYADIAAGKPSAMIMNVPSLVDPSLAPPGEHILSFSALVPPEFACNWDEHQARYSDLMVREAESMIPDLHNHVSPGPGLAIQVTMKDPAYGWEPSPEQIEEKRMGHETPIRGLYLSGHWTQPGLGLYSAIASGMRAAQTILDYPNIQTLLASLQPV